MQTPEGQNSLDTSEETTTGYSQESQLRAIIEQINIAEELDDDELNKIGEECRQGLEDDLESRSDWDRCVEEWTKLAIQAKKQKSWPWPNSANVKYPLVSTAAMQFAARAYPSLVPANGKVVSATVVGKDPDGQKLAQADRVSTYMSYQMMHEVPGWEESMDKLLIMLPVVGTIFKKTYWCPIKKHVISEIILPQDLVVNYWTRCLEDSERISHIIPMSKRKLKERQMSGSYLDIDLGEAPLPDQHSYSDKQKQPPAADDTTPYCIVEQHCYLDLDDDGYAEPYVVTFHKESGRVLRIAARYDDSTMYFNDDGKLEKICPIEYFTKFGFIPNPDGSFYDMGFGTLLGPLNEAVNSLINQLIDSGTLNNLQSGFLGKGLRLKLGEASFTPGEWKSVNATGTDLKQQILPLPTKEPSAVLFQLMGALITSGKELASVADIFTGKMPGQNTPATTTMATVEQGMKVFTAVYKRIYRSLASEFDKVFALNGTYLNPQTYEATIDVTVGPEDFKKVDGICTILPGADPSANSQQEKMQKAAALMQLLPSGMLNPVEVVRRNLEAMEQPDIDKLMNPQVLETGQPPPPPPDPKMLEIEAKTKAQEQMAQIKTQEIARKGELESRSKEAQLAMQAQEHQQNMASKREETLLNLEAQRANNASRIAEDRMAFNQSLVHREGEHQQKMQQSKQQTAQKAASKPTPKGGSKK